MTFKCKKGQFWPFRPWKMTFRAIQPNLSFDMWFMSPKRSFMPKKKKSYWSVSEIDPSPLNLDGRDTDRRTDGRTDRRTTDKSVLEKLRCLSAGGAKNLPTDPLFFGHVTPNTDFLGLTVVSRESHHLITVECRATHYPSYNGQWGIPSYWLQWEVGHSITKVTVWRESQHPGYRGK